MSEDFDFNKGKVPATEDFGTVAPDPRFPTVNCTKWCWSAFVDYHKCANVISDKDPACMYFYKVFTTICPNAWIQKWTDEINEGTFPVLLPKKADEIGKDGKPKKKKKKVC